MPRSQKDSRPKILIAMEGVLGGTLRHLDYLLRFADPAEWNIHLAVSAHRAPHVREDFQRWRHDGWRVHEIPMCREVCPARDLRTFRDLLSLCRAEQFELVHTHCAKAGFLGRLAGRSIGAPTVHTAHVFPFTHVGGDISRGLYRRLEQLAGHWTDRFIVLSDYQLNILLDAGLGRAGHTELIPNGIIPAEFEGPPRDAARRQLDLPPDAPIALFAGRFRSQKGIDVLLRAAHRLAATETSARIVIVGEGPQGQWLRRQIARHNLEDMVIDRGFAHRMPLYYAACDLLVMPSRAEGMPYVVLEAQAAGRPVAASLVSGMEEFIEHGRNGYLFPPNNPGALKEILDEALSDRPQLEAMGRHAREQFRPEWHARRMAEHTLRLYRHLIESGRR
jgi:glycosyltransferase involved in cell wall biosynthesis